MSDIQVTASLGEAWEELKVLVESIESDVAKNSSGNKSAGVRARKGLRTLKKVASDLVKMSLENDRD
jgi:hypothetical protein